MTYIRDIFLENGLGKRLFVAREKVASEITVRVHLISRNVDEMIVTI